MQYIQTIIEIGENETRDLLIARLSELGYEGFEENEQTLIAYLPEEDYDANAIMSLINGYELESTNNIIPKQNWNAVWERNFQPVIVEGFCTIKADFHELVTATPYEIIITPKMSFGTGHHATTQLMMMQMRHLPFAGAKVLDFGTGTGILAILAQMLGAASILAIDNDEWSYENATENAHRNNSTNVTIKHGSLDIAAVETFDIILANINRHILLQFMPDLYTQLNSGGHILMSGLLKEDEQIIVEAASAAGFKMLNIDTLNNWIVVLFTK
ncbi:MAG: 50S ribosomal protein L11 methyltransferase [Bacteroidetes bacterium]|nr:50S ribosomal protein L11 methyltransferase [Bacteroidota bacterium]